MSLFVTSQSTVNRHGVFAIERVPPTAIQPSGTGIAAIVGQFPWGPGGASPTIVRPTSVADFRKTFAPPGFTRTGTAYLMTLAAAFPTLYGLRVLGPTAAVATAPLQDAVPTTICTITLKCAGTEGNSVTCVVSAADDGDSNHFNLAVTRTSTSGTTTDSVKNINFSGTGADSTFDYSNSVIIGSITKNTSGRPVNGTTTASGGTNGTITSAEYVGTQGSGDKGFAKLETDLTVRHVFHDDCGNSLRAATNAGAKAHANYMTDRVNYIAGNSGQSASAAQTDVATYRSGNVVYVDPWAYVYDDVDGTKRIVPGNGFGASVASQLSPSTSIAWKDSKVRNMLGGIVELEADRGDAAGTNTNSGIATLIPFRKGGFVFEAGKVTDTTPGRTNLTRTNMGIFIAASVTDSLASNVDAPNVPANQQDVVNALTDFLDQLVANQAEANTKPYILGYTITPIATSNTQSSLDAGNFIIEANIKLGSSMEKIFFSVQYGENVRLQAIAA